MADWRTALSGLCRGEVRLDEPLSRHTTLRIGGPVDAWVAPADAEDLGRVRAFCAAEGIACRPLGGGSNLLVRDGGVRGVLISTKSLRRVERRGDVGVHCEAGQSTGKLLNLAAQWELGGLEFLGGVPGSVGGGLLGNAGTYLGEFKDVTTRVGSIDARGELVVRANAACGFVYRGSALPAEEIIVWADFALVPRPRAEIEEAVRGLRDRRRAREPKQVANAGSFFKNPPGDYAGRLIEACGLKGRRSGAAEISAVHANWIVNTGGATARDVLALVDLARAEVEARFGLRLELEVKVVGDD